MRSLLVMIGIFGFSLASAFASESPRWECVGANVEVAGVSIDRGHLTGSVSWDCFPGGGICGAEAAVTQTSDSNGDLVFQGPHFWLIIHVSSPAAHGGYRAHMIAKDTTNDEELGRGQQFDGFLSCREAEI